MQIPPTVSVGGIFPGKRIYPLVGLAKRKKMEYNSQKSS